jgi:CheY-like chemotaxis protein
MTFSPQCSPSKFPFAVAGKIVARYGVVAHEISCTFGAADGDLVSRLAKFAFPELPPKLIKRSGLVVDDNRDMADSLASLLRGVGHGVAVAYDGPTALDVARKERPTWFFSISCFHVYQEVPGGIRAFMGSTVQIIAVSGFGNEEAVRRSTAAGLITS